MATKKTASDTDLLRAAYDLLGDMSITHNVLIGYKVLPTAQRGVFEIVIAAFRDVPNRGTVRVCRYSLTYPNSQNMDLGGAFFRCANQLDHLLGDRKLEDTPARRSAD